MDEDVEIDLYSSSASYLRLADSDGAVPISRDHWRHRTALDTSRSSEEGEHRRDIQWHALSKGYMQQFDRRHTCNGAAMRRFQEKSKSKEQSTNSSSPTHQQHQQLQQLSVEWSGGRRISYDSTVTSLDSKSPLSTERSGSVISLTSGPTLRVRQLLCREDEASAATRTVHPVYTEMKKLQNDEWRTIARWIKYEENVEACGDRWSKPHIASLSLHSLFELRSCLMKNVVCLNATATSADEVADVIAEELAKVNLITFLQKEKVKETVLSHQIYRSHSRRRPHSASPPSPRLEVGGTTLRSRISFAVTDGSRRFSLARLLQKPTVKTPLLQGDRGGRQDRGDSNASHLSPPSSITKEDVSSVSADEFCSSSNLTSAKSSENLLKKIPIGSEAASVLIGETNFLSKPVSVFLRLEESVVLSPHLTEVPLPVRFVFVLLGPKDQGTFYDGIGRSIGTLFSDEVFHEIVYKARDVEDLLDGLDEFLDQVIVLPPSEWDPSIRIEPPSSALSTDKRKSSEIDRSLATTHKLKQLRHSMDTFDGSNEHNFEDESLRRTGRLFGGLIEDIKRKKNTFLHEFRNSLSLQTVAAVWVLYLLTLAHATTFGSLLDDATDGRMGVHETLISAALCGVAYSLFSGQPLAVLGLSGSMLLWESLTANVCLSIGLDYMELRVWIGLWVLPILVLVVMFDGAFVAVLVTRFTREVFSLTMSLLFVWESVWEMGIRASAQSKIVVYPAGRNRSCNCLGLNTTITIPPSSLQYGLMRKYSWQNASWFSSTISGNGTSQSGGNSLMFVINSTKLPLKLCEQFGATLTGNSCYRMTDVVTMSVVLMGGTFLISWALRELKNTHFFTTKTLQILSYFALPIAILLVTSFDVYLGIDTPKLIFPSSGHHLFGIVNPFYGLNPWWSTIFAIVPALVLALLIAVEHNMTVLLVNKCENRLKNGGGYHLDLILLAILVALCSLLRLPYFLALSVFSINHVDSLKIERPESAGSEKMIFSGCREQRLTTLGCSTLLGFTLLFPSAVKLIPLPVLYGAFLSMAVVSLDGIQLLERILLFFMPMKYQPDLAYVRNVQIGRVYAFTLIQVILVILLLVARLSGYTSVFIPIIIAAFIGLRKVLELFVFDKKELQFLDDEMPQFKVPEKVVEEKPKEDLPFIRSAMHLLVPLPSGNVMRIAYSPMIASSRLAQYKNPDLLTVPGSVGQERRMSRILRQSCMDNTTTATTIC